jgi:ribosomal protein S18 acetylase RimI-like enzyme
VSDVVVVEATSVDDELVEAWVRLLPQLSRSASTVDRDVLQRIVSAPTSRLLIARDVDQGIVGSLTLAMFQIPTGLRAIIEDVVVDESQRGRGVGELLTRAALDIAEHEGVRTVDLTTRPSREAANRLYQRVGFTKRETNVYRYEFK